ncbi:MAG: hypothetical protein K8R25_01305 [Methanosarcinales archaeon]|nr:hypothetical protein [Methanosarcinales archaeon]
MQGIWQGVLEVSGAKLRIVFNISAGQNSTLIATMDSPDQGVIGIPVDKVTFQNDNLDLEVQSIPGVYNGRFSEDDQIINGHWEQSGQSFPLILQRIEKAPVLNRPQEPKRPYPYEDEEVIYKNKTTGIELAGTLTLPTSEGVSDDEIAREREIQSRIFDVVKNETDNAAAEKKLNEILDEIEMPKENRQAEIEKILSPWFRYFLTYDPKSTLINVQCPVLAIIGEKDLQVPSEKNLLAIEEALGTGGNKNYTVMELPDLNHLFQTAITGSPSEYEQIEETISPSALEVIGDWILQYTEDI